MAEGEEARLTPEGPTAAQIVSRGYLPLRVRTEDRYRLRPAFPGTAVTLGDSTFEVVEEAEAGETVVYRLASWPQGEVARERVAYGPRLVRAAQADRERARTRERLRPWRWLLYPVVALLPEEPQERACDRLGLYSVTATLVSGLCEGLAFLAALSVAARTSDEGRRVVFALAAPLLLGFVVPGLGRAFSAAAFRETAGSWPVILGFEVARRLGRALDRRDATLVPMTRDAFWQRLALPDRIEREGDGSLLYTSTLPHLTWPGRRLEAGGHHWLVTVLPPALHRGRLLYAYRVERLGDPTPTGSPEPAGPAPTAYAEEVRAGIQREWDDLRVGFGWLVSLLPERLQGRACDRRGGPAAIRRWTVATAATAIILALYHAHRDAEREVLRSFPRWGDLHSRGWTAPGRRATVASPRGDASECSDAGRARASSDASRCIGGDAREDPRLPAPLRRGRRRARLAGDRGRVGPWTRSPTRPSRTTTRCCAATRVSPRSWRSGSSSA